MQQPHSQVGDQTKTAEPPQQGRPQPASTLRRWQKSGLNDALLARLDRIPLRVLIEYARWRMETKTAPSVGSTTVEFYFDQERNLRQMAMSEKLDPDELERKSELISEAKSRQAIR